MTQITVGLDFGTHQTKVCIEKKDGVELEYDFFLFKDHGGNNQFTLPSIIEIGSDGLLSYGYDVKSGKGKNVIKYFKQSAFQTTLMTRYSEKDGKMYAIWYLAYILFDLEETYGQEFSIQMGVPSDSSHVIKAKHTAVSLIVSAYKLVEEVFENDKNKFLSTPISELKKVTEIVPYSDDIKRDYGILVFPEAYACLRPLIQKGKIANGMNLMVDIGGGTTDISFFTIDEKEKKPRVYDFYSLGEGLNFLTAADSGNLDGVVVKDKSLINTTRKNSYFKDVDKICGELVKKLQYEFRRQTRLHTFRLMDALRTRPIVYSGGGSTFKQLLVGHHGFNIRKQVNTDTWNTKSVTQINEIRKKGLSPILSTAYGLAISVANDKIDMMPFADVFEKMRGAEEMNHKVTYTFGKAISSDGFDYGMDWDAYK